VVHYKETTMYMYSVPVGHLQIAVEIMSSREAEEHDFSQTPVKNGKLIKPGDAFMTSVKNCPIVIATAGSKMMVAHTKRAGTINTVTTSVIKAMKRKKSGDRIVMCMQFGDKALESAFVERLLRARIWHSWAMLSLNGFPALIRARDGDDNPDQWSLIRIRHSI